MSWVCKILKLHSVFTFYTAYYIIDILSKSWCSIQCNITTVFWFTFSCIYIVLFFFAPTKDFCTILSVYVCIYRCHIYRHNTSKHWNRMVAVSYYRSLCKYMHNIWWTLLLANSDKIIYTVCPCSLHVPLLIMKCIIQTGAELFS